VDYTRGDLRFHRESFVSNPEVGRRALARHEAKLHQLTRGIVDEDQQGARCAPILEPAVLTAVDLDQLAVGFTPQARLMKASSLLARQPQPILDHPPAQRLSRDLDSVLLEQNLRRQARAEIGIARPNQFDHILVDARNKTVVGGAATSLVDQRTATTIAIRCLSAAGASASCSTPESPRPKSQYVALPELRKEPLCVAVRVRSSSPSPISASRTSSSEG
jgi:hypothetical protein